MASITSPSHTFGGTNAEQLSTTDDRSYAAVCVIARAGNSAGFQLGGPEVTATTGGQPVGGSGPPSFWFAIPGRPIKLTELYAAGATSDVVDLICVAPNATLAQA
jgi:hypothetical protein